MSHSIYPFATKPLAADINRDGRLDLIGLAEEGSNSYLTVLFGNRNGQFPWRFQNRFPLSPSLDWDRMPAGLCMGDFNHDGFVDVAVGNAERPQGNILYGRGTGSFAPGLQLTNLGFAPQYILSADLNNDGKEDLVYSGRKQRTRAYSIYSIASVLDDIAETSLFWQHDYGAIARWKVHGTNVLEEVKVAGNRLLEPSHRVVGSSDFNKDGEPDLLLHHYRGTSIAFLKENRVSATQWLSPSRMMKPLGVVDLDGDGNPELLAKEGCSLYSLGVQGNRVTQAVSLLMSTRFSSPDLTRFIGTSTFYTDADLLWEEQDGGVRIDIFNKTSYVASFRFRIGAGWRIIAAKDFNNDGWTDFLAQDDKRRLAISFMQAGRCTSTALLRGGRPVGQGWHLAATH